MIIARFENGDWTVLDDGQCVDFLEVDDEAPEDIDSALLDGRYRIIVAGQRVNEYGINRIQLIDGEGDKVRDGWPAPSGAESYPRQANLHGNWAPPPYRG